MRAVRRVHTAAALLLAALMFDVTSGAQLAKTRVLPGADSSNFMDIDQITKANVEAARGGVVLSVSAPRPSIPVVVDGVLYGLGRNGSSLVALDATTGKEIWIHEGLNGIVSKGINYWQSEDGKDRRLLFSVNSFLQAIDARTGKSIMTFGNERRRRTCATGLRARKARASARRRSSPGRIWRNTADSRRPSGRGVHLAARRHPRVRRHHRQEGLAVPHRAAARRVRLRDVAEGRATSTSAARTTGARCRSTKSAASSTSRPDRRPTISTAPTGTARTSSPTASLALDARTGKRLWHFQTIHHDLWDLDNVSAPQLVTVRHNGRRIDAVAHAGKTGFLYVFNRVTGEPLWPIEERPVPQTDVPGEQACADAAVPDEAAAVRQADVHRGRRQSVAADAGAVPERCASASRRRRTAPARRAACSFRRRSDERRVSMPGNQGGVELGHDGRAIPTKGMVFVVERESGRAAAARGREDARQPAGRSAGGGSRRCRRHAAPAASISRTVRRATARTCAARVPACRRSSA